MGEDASAEAALQDRRREFAARLAETVFGAVDWQRLGPARQGEVVALVEARVTEHEKRLLRGVALTLHDVAGGIETHDDYDDGLRQGYREAADLVDPTALDGSPDESI